MPNIFFPEEHKLSNGIPVVFQHYEGLVAATYWWVRIGSCDEAPGEEGFAHFLEHMLFKDAAAREIGIPSSGRTARAIESLGGDINAYTAFDQTVYHVTCAENQWEKVIDIFGDMAGQKKFLRTDFEREKEVILEEVRRNEDSPERQLFQTLFSQTYSKHPYGRPVIGYSKTLKKAKHPQLESFFRRNYVAGNMGLVLVGPLDDSTGERRKILLKKLEKKFGSAVLPAQKTERYVRPAEKVLRDKVNVVSKAFDVQVPSFAFSFRGPELRHPDVPALDLAAGVLGVGELSRLYQRVFYKKSLATEVSGGLYIPRDPGMIYFEAGLNDIGKLDQLATEMFEEVNRLCLDGPEEEELSRIIVNAESERLYSTQTADGIAGRLGFMRFALGDLNFDHTYLEMLKTVSSGKISEILRKYLDHKRMCIVTLLPEKEARFEMSYLKDQAKRFFTADQKKHTIMKHKNYEGEDTPPVETFTRASGLRVVYCQRQQSHGFCIQASVLGGLRLELGNQNGRDLSNWGVSHMLALTWAKGTSTKNAQDIARIVEGHAANLDGFSGRNSVGLEIIGLSRDWKILSELFKDVLFDPSFPEDEILHSRRVAEDDVRAVEDHSGQLCSKMFLETLFESHPYGFLLTGSLESLPKIDRVRLLAFHHAWLRPDRLVISVTGNINRADLENWLEKLEKSPNYLKSAGCVNVPEAILEEFPAKGPRWARRKLGREQVHIIVGNLGARMGAEDRYALRLIQTVLGGQSGRLFLELREKKSIAYSVAPLAFEGLEPGYLGTYIACSASKEKEALDCIHDLYEKLAAKGLGAAEMKRAKEFFLGRRVMDLQSDQSLAGYFGLRLLYGIPVFDRRNIEKVTSSEISQFCRRHYLEPHKVISVVG